MREQVTLYPAARNLLWSGLGGLVLAGGSVFLSLSWRPTWVATGFLLASALAAIALGLVSSVAITPTYLIQNRNRIAWSSICQVQRLLWTPLVVRLTLASRDEVLVFYAGNESSRAGLLRDIQRMSTGALIDGVSHEEFWHDEPEAGSAFPEESAEETQYPEVSRRSMRPSRYPVLLPEDEAEVERLFQQLKSAGHIDPKNRSEEK